MVFEFGLEGFLPGRARYNFGLIIGIGALYFD